MLKAVANGNKGRVVVLGLSRKDLSDILNESPLQIDLRQFGFELDLLIMGGSTNESMKDALASLIPISRIARDASPQEVDEVLKKS